MNLWHEVPRGDKIPDELNVVIEINKGSKNKYEIDKETGLIALDRAMKTSQDYPYDYGFVPQTYWHDDDALDVIVLTTYPLEPGILVRVRPVALMHMTDSGDNDDKVIAVPVDDLRWDNVHDLGDINPHTLKEIDHFYSTYKRITDDVVEVSGFEGAEAAKKAVQESIELYKAKFSK